MKNFLILLVYAACLSVVADNLVTKEGSVYKNVTIVSADPERMLIVHDGGGDQVYFDDLVPDSLTPQQRAAVESEIREHLARKDRQEKFRLEREAFEQEQREKGLVPFEDLWMTPLEREEILAKRETQRLEQEKLKVELAKKQAELRKEQMLAEKAERELEEQNKRSRFITTTYYGPYYPYPNNCRPKPQQPVSRQPYGYVPKPKPGCGSSYYDGPSGISISLGGRSSSSSSSSTITVGPVNQ